MILDDQRPFVQSSLCAESQTGGSREGRAGAVCCSDGAEYIDACWAAACGKNDGQSSEAECAGEES